ncbi:MAG TPA: valine--tRNA ligase [Tepidisphaeraceae bacterium]|jgi:valyl-tRNA synthetase
MPVELPKSYDFTAVQTDVLATWEAENCFHAEPTDAGVPYSIVIPPPNVTAALHLGHALNNTVQDILVRRARMQGKNAVWIPGTDHAGIATQTVVEKRVLKEEGKRRTEFGRDEFVAKIQTWKDEYEKVILGQLKSMGCSCDWDRTAFTMDEPRAKAVREAFFQLFKAGLIYRGKRLVNWDPVTQTALADDEVEMEDVDGFFYYLKYPICDAQGNVASADHAPHAHGSAVGLKDDDAYLTVATTRPETMLGDTAIAVNPTDPRAAALRGKYVKLPIVNRIIPIIEDGYVVKPVQYGGDPADPKAQLATGFLKVTPAHDPNDYDIGQRHKLPVINVMAPDATISLAHGWAAQEPHQQTNETLMPLCGLARETAREQIVEWFRRHDLLGDVKPYRHAVGHSYRSHAAIEPYLSDQWYCKVTDDRLRGAALRAMTPSQRGTGFPPVSAAERPNPPAAEHGLKTHATKATADTGITFYPDRYAKTYQTWHENIRDWCISRQLWWGHRIPVWTKIVNRSEVGDKQRDSKPPINWAGVGREQGCEMQVEPLSDGRDALHIAIPASVDGNELRNLVDALERQGYQQDQDVLDTWFSSGLWPISTLGWPAIKAPLLTWNPTSVLCTAREIITLWVSRMVMFNEFFQGQIPFKHVFIHAMIQDGEGRKMSKSLGNGVDPLDIISSHGADAMRYTLASMTTHTQDVRLPVERDLATGKNTSLKFDLGRNFANKIWNAARFVLMQIEGVALADPAETASRLSLADRWILSKLSRAIADADAAIDGYRFDQYAKTLYDFFWRDLCDWYLEAAKPQMKDAAQRSVTARVLATLLDASMRLLHPAVPFVTEKIWWELNRVCPQRGVPGWIECPPSQRAIKAQWPAATRTDEAAEQSFTALQNLIVAVRTLRSDFKVDPKKTVDVAVRIDVATAAVIDADRSVVETLAICRLAAVGPDTPATPDAAKAPFAGGEIYVEGVVDKSAELQRVTKRRDELTKAVAALKGRLSNASYTAKAPPHLVQQTQTQLAEAEAELATLSG